MAERNEGGIIFGFLFGAVIGGILGLIFAPQSGRITRAKVSDFMDDMGEKGKDFLEKGKVYAEKGEEYLEKQKNKFIKKEE